MGDPEARWWSKVDLRADGCWIWLGGLDRGGYGQFDVTVSGKHRNYRAHRWGYQRFVRELETSETLDHVCRTHACVRFDHLDPVSHAENVRRGEGGRHNAAKTHCARGHEFNPSNTAVGPRGWRVCISCRNDASRESQRKRRGYQGGITSKDKTHCKHGHEFTPENTILRHDGCRGCRECGRVAARDYMRRRRIAG